MALHQELLFSVNENETLVRIDITDDDLVESDEIFQAVLSEVSEAGDVMTIEKVNVTIKDNDGEWDD